MNNAEQDVAIADLKRRLDGIDGADSWRNWLKPKTNKITAAGVLLTVVSGIVAVIAWVQPEWSTHAKQDRQHEVADEVRLQLKPVIETLNSLTKEVATLTATVTSLNENVQLLLQNAIKTSASLSQTQFNNNLQAVSSQLGIARQLRAQVEPATVEDIRLKLTGSDKQEQPPLWKAKAELISYESSRTTRQNSIDMESLPTCGFRNMSELTYDSHYQCKVVLDGLTLTNVRLRNAIIVYKGGKLNLHNVQLDHCYFSFQLDSVPQPDGRDYMNALLASPELEAFTVG